MINQFMKKISAQAYLNDLDRIDSSKFDSNVKTVKDLSYINDDSIEHTLDVYYVSNHIYKPVLIDIHGGGFISGSKEADSLFANFLARRGFTVFTLNYRLAYPAINVFDQIEDISNAVQWILAHAEHYEADINELYIAGHSAGGVLAVAESLLCHDWKMRAAFNIPERDYMFQGIILDCGAMHVYKKSLAYWGMRNMIFPKGYKAMEQYQYLVFENNPAISSLPKTVLITNEKDELRKMTYQFKTVLEKYSVEHKLFNVGAGGHTGILFAPDTDEYQKMLGEIQDYFEIGLCGNL